MHGFPILMYHRITSGSCPVPDADREEARYAVPLVEFIWQLDCIAGMGLRGVSMREAHGELLAGRPVPREWVVLTFDDGNSSDHVHARPLLRDRGFSATFFVTGCRIGVVGGLEPVTIRALADDAMDVGSHGMTHRFLTTLTPAEEFEELARSKGVLEELSGGPVRYFAPPGGRMSDRTASALRRASYQAVCTSEFGFNSRNRQQYAYKRIPIVAATSRACYRRVVAGDAVRLAPLYLKQRVLRLARGVLGEARYGKLRARGLGS